MLRLMRDYATSWMIKFILGAIVLVFVFWGVGSFDAGKAAKVAVVNDRVITIEEYRETYNNLVEQVRRNFGGSLDETMLENLGLRRQALEQLIDQALLVQQAEALQFRVTDEELASAIRNIPAFQRAGVFDSRLYQNILSRYRMSPEEFEIAQRRAMLVDKVRTLVTRTVQVSEDEMMAWYTWQNTQVDLEFVRFSPSAYEEAAASEEEVKSRFESNPDPYKTEEKVKVRYIRFAPENYTGRIEVSTEQARRYYEENTEEFSSPRTVEARHILFKVDRDAGEEAAEAARKKAVEVLEMAEQGEDFAELAQRYSEGPSAGNGGYLGTFEKTDMVAPFAEKAFSMEAGEVGGPVRTRFGWHLIKVEKVNEASRTPFEAAEEEIRGKIALSEARTLAYEEAGAVYDVSFEGDDLVEAAQEKDLNLQTTDFFARSGPQTGVGNRTEFARAAFALDPMEISDILEIEEDYYILQLLEKLPAKIPEYAEVAGEVRADVVQEKKEQQAEADARAFLEALKAGKQDPAGENRPQARPLQSTGFFKRNEQIPQIGYAQQISQAAFMLTEQSPIADEVLKGPDGVYVIRLKERRNPAPEQFEGQKTAIEQALRNQKEQRAFSDWLAQVKSESEIVIEEEFVE